MHRTLAILLILSSPAHAVSTPAMWPQYAEDEGITAIAPVGEWINDDEDAWRWFHEGCTTDADCEAMVSISD